MAGTFGGSWTQEKLEILRRYLDAYTTVLSRRRFQLIYVDAFAGGVSYPAASGYVPEDYSDFRELRDSSPQIALAIQDKPFDRLVFIEKDAARCRSLDMLRKDNPDRDIELWNTDANEALPYFCDLMGDFDRAVVFLDPFATQVSWVTVEGLAQTEKIDCWILFPVMAIARMMPTDREPPDALAAQLDRIFGGRAHWEGLYSDSPQQLSLLSTDPSQRRLRGSGQIAARYRERLESIYARVAGVSRTLKNSRNSPMFELFFAASNPVGAERAVPIADYILKNW